MQPDSSQPPQTDPPTTTPDQAPTLDQSTADMAAQQQSAADAATRQTPMVTMSMGEIATESTTAVPAGDGGVVQWQAQEYITTDKNPLWYAGLAVFVVAAVLLDWFVLKTFFTVSLLAIVIAAVVVVMHVRPARMLNYTLDDESLRIGDQVYPLSEYKSFGVLHDGKENSIHLIPVKRFRPSLQVYFPVESGEAIVDSLGARLPMEELHLDFVDRIVHLFRL